MDISTAKTLVSATLVLAIFIFSYFSIEMFISEMIRDLKAARAQRRACAKRVRSETV